jgi:hypothetical protein
MRNNRYSQLPAYVEKNRFYSLVRFLKNKLSVSFSVRRVKCPKNTLGDCCYYGKKYLVRVDKNLPEIFAMEVVCHEASHCLSWHSSDKDDHGPAFGRAYAKVYRLFLQWFNKNTGD